MLVQNSIVHDAFAMYFWMVIRRAELRCTLCICDVFLDGK